jgi:IS5 family transposase
MVPPRVMVKDGMGGRRLARSFFRSAANRCRYRGDAGMKRWVGLGVIADNILNIGRAMEKQAAP